MIDILLYETGSGGEIIIRNNDVVTVAGYENMPYIAQFGGNGSWMDDLLLTGDQRHTSQTEQALIDVPLTSAGRIAINNAMEADLEFLSDDIAGTKVEVNTTIASRNRMDAAINAAGNTIYMNWNPDTLFLTYKLAP